jgi:starvation-inducible DNA-binding protein
MYETENNISVKRRSELNALMNQRLASAVDLQMQMKQAHWNVKGPSFIGLHELFDKVDEAVESYVDMIVERIVQLGDIADGTVRGRIIACGGISGYNEEKLRPRSCQFI